MVRAVAFDPTAAPLPRPRARPAHGGRRGTKHEARRCQSTETATLPKALKATRPGSEERRLGPLVRRGFRETSPRLAACWAGGRRDLGWRLVQDCLRSLFPSPSDPRLAPASLPRVRAVCVLVVIAILSALLTEWALSHGREGTRVYLDY